MSSSEHVPGSLISSCYNRGGSGTQSNMGLHRRNRCVEQCRTFQLGDRCGMESKNRGTGVTLSSPVKGKVCPSERSVDGK